MVVHNEGTVLGWRGWTTANSGVSLRTYFSAGVNTCPSTSSSVGAGRNTLGTSSWGYAAGTLVQKEPLVMNFGSANVLYTNSGGANDMNRITTDSDNSDRNAGWGVGTMYDAQTDGNAMTCAGISHRPQCDAQTHAETGNWDSASGWGGDSRGGMIGSDNVCNGGCPWTLSNGYQYDYAIYVTG